MPHLWVTGVQLTPPPHTHIESAGTKGEQRLKKSLASATKQTSALRSRVLSVNALYTNDSDRP